MMIIYYYMLLYYETCSNFYEVDIHIIKMYEMSC
jgi:hypothetical protein